MGHRMMEQAQSEAIPDGLRLRRQWVLWRYVLKPGAAKPTKVPYQPSGAMASHSDPDTWSDFAQAMSVVQSYDGVGFVFSPDDPYCGIDLDQCFDAQGTLRSWAVPIVSMAQECGCYIERTPSGVGLHVIGMASLPGDGRKVGGLGEDKAGAIEVYDRTRYFTVTGEQTDIGDASGDLTPLIVLLWDRYGFDDKTRGKNVDYGSAVSDTEAELLVRRALSGATSEFIGHWSGRWDAKHYPGPSEARMGLLVKIALKLGPAVTPAEVQAVALRSGLIREEIKARGNAKWPRLAHRECDLAVSQARRIAGADSPPVRFGILEDRAAQVPGQPTAVPILVPLDESSPIRPMPQIIRGILPADAVGMVWGAPGSYKSFLALDWALCIASGQEWLCHQVKQGTVWYLAGEGQAGLRHRVQAWRQARNYRGPIDFLHSQRAVLLDADHGHSPGLTALLSLIASGRAPDLIVVDTLARSMAGDESATKDASRYVAALDELVAAVRRAGKRCTVILIHHSRKDGDVYRGSSVLRGAADFEFEMGSTGSFKVRLFCHKVKDTALPPPFYLRLEAEMLGTAVDDFGIEVTMTSLAIWMEQAPQEQDKAHEKAAELMSHLRPLLRPFQAGRSQAALTAALHEAGVRFDKTYLPGFLELLAEQGEIVIEYGARGAKLVRLASNDLPDLPAGGRSTGDTARPGKRA